MWTPKIETMSRPDMSALQLARLRETAARTYEAVPAVRRKWDEIGLLPRHITTLQDARRIPFTVKADLRDNYPYGLFARPMREVVRIHASSGTTGKPTVVGYTQKDLDMWADGMARLIVMAGGGPDDIAQIAFGYGLFTGALGLHYGLEKVGCTVIPVSSGNTERQIMLMRDLQTTLLIATPAYALVIAEALEKMDVPRGDIRLRVGLFGGEGCTPATRAAIEAHLHIRATQNYGLSEIIGPGVSGECLCQCGLHVNEDLYYPEIIDPQTGEVLPEGAEGELVLTTLQKEALPMLRYRTRDLTRLVYEPCKCGRTLVRHEPIRGRSDDMLIIRGVNVFPSQIEDALLDIQEIGPHYEIVVTREGHLDRLEVKVELIDASLLGAYRDLEGLREKIRNRLRTRLQIDALVSLCGPQSLQRFEGKAKRVSDLRPKD